MEQKETEENFIEKGLRKAREFMDTSLEISQDTLAFLQKNGSRARGPLNAMLGDRLAHHGNSIAFTMGMHYIDEAGNFLPLTLEKAELKKLFASSGGRVVIFLHGLGGSEHTWNIKPRGAEAKVTSFGKLLERDRGLTPLYVNYNSGKHISENGRELAALLTRFSRVWPGRLKEIILVGHSMGGLVMRSAGYYGRKKHSRWVRKMKANFLLGSPLLGAHTEQIGHLTSEILSLIPVPATAIISKIINLRSNGIQDLRYGYLRDEDWQRTPEEAEVGNNRKQVPLLKHVTYHMILGNLAGEKEGILNAFIGDGIVHRNSGRGQTNHEKYEEYNENLVHEVPGIHHGELTLDLRVYRQLRSWIKS